ncbi:MAG: citramalate synthase [Planctomycetia bacterium]|nr:citramalate synthase [Planctomycetia bacterium]
MRTIEIYDTTLRDGSQGEGVNFSLEDKLAITRRLDEAGIDFIEGGYPLSNPKDAQYFERVRGLNLRHSRVCAFGMTRRRGMTAAADPGMRALIDAGTPVVTIVGKTSAFHVSEVLGVSREENLAMISDTVGYLTQAGREVFYDAEHFFDGWKLDADYSAETIVAAARAGATRIVCCDTNGGTLPDEIARILGLAAGALKRAGHDRPLAIHCHNDCDLAVANSLAAVAAGAVQVQGTINGIGERCGNADLISVVANLALKLPGYTVLGGNGAAHLTELSRFVYETANMSYRPGQPFVGSSAFAHKGGMHVHAVVKATESYEHIAPEAVGNSRRILVSELSGRSNIAALVTRADVKNDRTLLDAVLAEVCRLENEGWQFEAAGASFDLLVDRCAGTFTPAFVRDSYNVDVESRGDGDVRTLATVKLQVAGGLRHEVAEGDGPVNALDAALRKALAATYPAVERMHLLDYKVRVINAQEGTAAKVRVSIESTDGDRVWGTVGVSENVIEASWLALADSFHYVLRP